MRSTVEFFRCEICGNIVELIKDGGAPLVCCGQEMNKLEAGTEDDGFEKHVPVAKREGDHIEVKIGSVAHPMLEAHFIEWIAIVTDDGIERINLTPDDKPEAVFCACDDTEEVDIYEYCNVHGLWKSSL